MFRTSKFDNSYSISILMCVKTIVFNLLNHCVIGLHVNIMRFCVILNQDPLSHQQSH